MGSLSAAALGKLTNNNTRRNEARVADLDVQVIFKDEPRPPSPGSKVRTVAQKESDEAEQARHFRARRRTIMRGGDPDAVDADDLGESDASVSPSKGKGKGKERPLKHPRAPGDEEEYNTPKRIRIALEAAAAEEAKGSKNGSGTGSASGSGSGSKVPSASSASTLSTSRSVSPGGGPRKKFVRWNKALTDVAPGRLPSNPPSEDAPISGAGPSDSKKPRRSALSREPSVRCRYPLYLVLGSLMCSFRLQLYGLDVHGNPEKATQPVDGIKKTKIIVTKFVFADDPLDDPDVQAARASSRQSTPSAS